MCYINDAKGRGVRARSWIEKGTSIAAYPGSVLARLPYHGKVGHAGNGTGTAYKDALRRFAHPTTRYTISHAVSNAYIAEWNAHCRRTGHLEPAPDPSPDDPTSEAGVIYMIDSLCDLGTVKQLAGELDAFPFCQKAVEKLHMLRTELGELAAGNKAYLPSFAFRVHAGELQRRLPDDTWCTFHPTKVSPDDLMQSLYHGWIKDMHISTEYPHFGCFINEPDEPSEANVEFVCFPASYMARCTADESSMQLWDHPVPYMVTTRDIYPGEELLVNYNSDED